MLAVAGAGALPQPVLASILAVCWAIDCSIALRVLVRGDTGGGGGPRSPLRWAGGEVGVPPLRWVDCLPPQASLERKGERGGTPPLLACNDRCASDTSAATGRLPLQPAAGKTKAASSTWPLWVGGGGGGVHLLPALTRLRDLHLVMQVPSPHRRGRRGSQHGYPCWRPLQASRTWCRFPISSCQRPCMDSATLKKRYQAM